MARKGAFLRDTAEPISRDVLHHLRQSALIEAVAKQLRSIWVSALKQPTIESWSRPPPRRFLRSRPPAVALRAALALNRRPTAAPRLSRGRYPGGLAVGVERRLRSIGVQPLWARSGISHPSKADLRARPVPVGVLAFAPPWPKPRHCQTDPMKIDDSLLMLAGFTFAHAVWNVSDLLEGELLVPLAIVEKAGERQLIRFEAETQEDAIAKGKETLAQHEAELDSWVFAREGQVNEGGVYVDVLTIEARSVGALDSVVFVQRFQPFASGSFRLIGEPLVAVDGRQLPEEVAAPMLRRLNDGVLTHGKAAALWSEWSAT